LEVSADVDENKRVTCFSRDVDENKGVDRDFEAFCK
jgi:hypothetical protein